MIFSSETEGWSISAGFDSGQPSVIPEAHDRTIPQEFADSKVVAECLASVEAGYVPGVLALCSEAQRQAMLMRKSKKLAVALLGVLPALRALTHATAAMDVMLIAHICGELLEDEYRRTGERADSHAAIGAYKLEAEAVASARPGQIPAWCTPFAWNSLGIALKREGDWDMAARAYRWALCHPRPREDLAVYRNTLATVLGNTLVLLEMCAWEKPSSIKRSDKMNTREQSAVFLPTDHKCAMCGKELTSKEVKKFKSCSIVTYCSRDCHVAHWGAHKKACKLARSS
jgi:hypothetical protein